jgi:hypothetical protein
MLIDHAKPERVRGMWILNDFLAVADQKLTLVGAVISHDAFDQGRLAGTVLTEQGMKAPGANFE